MQKVNRSHILVKYIDCFGYSYYFRTPKKEENEYPGTRGINFFLCFL